MNTLYVNLYICLVYHEDLTEEMCFTNVKNSITPPVQPVQQHGAHLHVHLLTQSILKEREDGLLRGVDHDDEAEENEIVGEEVGFGVTVGSEVFGRVCLGGSDPPMMIPNLHSTRVIP